MFAVVLALLLTAPAATRAPVGSFAVLAGRPPGDDPTEALGAVPALAQALESRGASAVTGSALWRGLGRKLREVGSDLPAGAERVLDDAGQAFDEGRFDVAAKLAEEAVARLDHAPRSVAVEARERAAQLLCGLAQLASGGPEAVAREHLIWALAREPKLTLDPTRFSPPLRQQVEASRQALAALPRALLVVSGTSDASVYVDGLLSGQAVNGLVPHEAWVWLERAGRRSFAHHVELLAGGATSVSIDLDVEAALGMGSDGQPVFTALRGDPETPKLLARLAAQLETRAVAVLSRCAGAGFWQLEAVAAGRAISLHREVGAGGAPPLDDLARELLAEAAPGEAAAPETKLGSSAEVPVAASTPLAPSVVEGRPSTSLGANGNSVGHAKAWPWIVAAIAVVAVATGVGLYFTLRPSNATGPDASIYASQGSP